MSLGVVTGNVEEEVKREVVDFLIAEAELLSSHKYAEWLDILTDDIDYQMPVRITREKEKDQLSVELSKKFHHFYDDKKSLEMKAKRLLNEYAWSENPPSRLVYLITNVRIEKGERSDEVNVKSDVLFIRSRRDEWEYEFLPYQRRDVLRKVDGKWKLRKRFIIPLPSVIPLRNLDNLL